MANTAMLIVPHNPTGSITDKERGDLRSDIVNLARSMADVTWGGVPEARGITGMTVSIPRHKLWINPLCAVEYDLEEVKETARTLAENGQLAPLIVTPARDPRPRSQGGTGGEYLVLDGAKRLRAAVHAGHPTLEDLVCVVQVHANAYVATKAAVTMKASQHPLSDQQAGSLLRRLRAVYDATKRGERLEEWPAQEDWAAIFGRSQSTISRWLAIADMHPTVVQLVEDGRIADSTARELQPLSRLEQRQVADELLEEADRNGSPTIPHKRARQLVQQRRRGPMRWVDAEAIQMPLDLVLEGLEGDEVPVALAKVAHDSIRLLDAALDGMDEKHPALVAWQRALAHPAIREFVSQVVAEPEDAED